MGSRDEIGRLEVSPEGGKKYSGGKLDWSLFDKQLVAFVEEMLVRLDAGQHKYGRYNWKLVEKERYRAALGRHLAAAIKEEGARDSDIPTSEWAAVATNAFFLWYLESENSGV